MDLPAGNPPQSIPVLSEDAIKKAFLPFLRNFYKDRYAIQHGSMQASLDNVSASGLVADGKITFLKTDHEDPNKREYFVCTYEATSLDKVDEVKFQLNQRFFLWECAAFTALVTTGFYVASYLLRTHFLYSLGAIGNIGLVISFALLSFSFWFFSMRNWKRYRYIYAVEQFKQYFADEQWVALGEDVFLNPLDKYLEELKNQCIFNGFGLAVVFLDGQVRVLVAPSRLGIYGKDRKMTDWLTEHKVYKGITGNVQQIGKMREKIPNALTVSLNKIWRPFDYYLIRPIKNTFWTLLAGPAQKTNTVYNGFVGKQQTQKLLIVLSSVILVFYLQKILKHKTFEYPTEGEYLGYLERRLSRANPEDQRGYVLDDVPVRYGIPKQDPIPVAHLEEEEDDSPAINLSGDDDDAIDLSGGSDTQDGDSKDVWETVPSKTEAKPVAASTKGSSLGACAMLQGKKGWLVQDSYFSEKEFADVRMAQLKKRGIPCFQVAKNCLVKNATGYYVFLGNVMSQQAEALSEKENYHKALKRYGLLKETLILKKIG